MNRALRVASIAAGIAFRGHGRALASIRKDEARLRSLEVREALGTGWQKLSYAEIRRQLVELNVAPPKTKAWSLQSIKNVIERPFHDR